MTLPFPATASLRLCGYRVPAGEQGTGKPTGVFAYGRILPPEQGVPVARALTTLPPACACADVR
ncbi:hypothetical protein O7606_17575 [Micromonospora sp. WMMD882]|uniref:hypothetical protein n=1 Tax=Micromonospora sp. WMMD882 TaxID=3015151 RepID=UPI00248CDB6E|nr:hypothetical protein [Micromonospora sp. WMMD882]WBB78053.1 hypothetical protein O7606_17575 [Micromonospora sp. WMMD882]